MSFPASISQNAVDTVLIHLTPLFRPAAGGDEAAARDTASHTLDAFKPETDPELNLAAEIVGLRLQLLEALGQAAAPDQAMNKILRLRSGAVSMSRQAHHAERKLDQLQRDRRSAATAEQPAPQPEPASTQAAPPGTSPISAEQVTGAVQDALKILTKGGGQPWSKMLQKRENARLITANLKKNQADYLARQAAANAAAPNTIPAPEQAGTISI